MIVAQEGGCESREVMMKFLKLSLVAAAFALMMGTFGASPALADRAGEWTGNLGSYHGQNRGYNRGYGYGNHYYYNRRNRRNLYYGGNNYRRHGRRNRSLNFHFNAPGFYFRFGN
jgi:hypothetical protein